MPLFNLSETEFTLHSGGKSRLLIDCTTLTDADWRGIAYALAGLLPPFRDAVGIPRGGLPLERALTPYATDDDALPLLLCDDVLTTGASMEQYRGIVAPPVIGAVFIARGPCPGWITPLLRLTPAPTDTPPA
jgi:hypothetical protein